MLTTLIFRFLFQLLAQVGDGPDNQYIIQFSKIDNQAKVYVEDSLVFTSKVYDANPDLNVKFDLSEYLKKGINQVKVELINGSGEGIIGYDQDWQIFYEIFENTTPIDFMSEKSNNGKPGLVFSMTHEITVQ